MRAASATSSFPRTRKSSPCRFVRQWTRFSSLPFLVFLTTGKPHGKQDSQARTCAPPRSIGYQTGGPSTTPHGATPPGHIICLSAEHSPRLLASGLIFIGDSRDRRLNVSLKNPAPGNASAAVRARFPFSSFFSVPLLSLVPSRRATSFFLGHRASLARAEDASSALKDSPFTPPRLSSRSALFPSRSLFFSLFASLFFNHHRIRD